MIATDFAPFKTYIVEKQTLIAKALHVFFNQQPYANVVGDATSLQAAQLQRTRPDLLVFGLDNSVDDLASAIQLARSINSNIRVCVLSSFPNPELMQHCMNAGADAFLLKDVSVNELDVAMRVLAAGSCYVDPRVAGRMMQRREGGTADTARRIEELTAREAEILRYIAAGLANKEIGDKLKLSEKTIKNYVSRLFVKLNVSARTQAAVYAIKTGIA